MKKMILILMLFILSIPVFAQLGQAVELTTADSVYDVVCLDEWLMIAVYDTAAADTITVWYPYTDITIDLTTSYAPIGKIMDLSTGENDTVLAGTADTKYYILWIPSPRAVRFLLSDYATGNVEIKASPLP